MAFSIGFSAGAPAHLPAIWLRTVSGRDFTPGSDRAPPRPPATFFTINAVLAKLDGQRGRGPDALRLASLPPSDVATDAHLPEKETPPLGIGAVRPVHLSRAGRNTLAQMAGR